MKAGWQIAFMTLHRCKYNLYALVTLHLYERIVVPTRYDFVDCKAALLHRVSISGQNSVMLCSCERMYKSVQCKRYIYIYIYIYIYVTVT